MTCSVGVTTRRVGLALILTTCLVASTGCMTSARSAHDRQFNHRIVQGEPLDDDLALAFGLGRHEPRVVAAASE